MNLYNCFNNVLMEITTQMLIFLTIFYNTFNNIVISIFFPAKNIAVEPCYGPVWAIDFHVAYLFSQL